MQITVLLENSTNNDALQAQWGLSLWLEHENAKILFDFGQNAAFANNAAALGINLNTATDLVLSHGHYDHSGGMAHALPLYARFKSPPRLVLHPAVTLLRHNKTKNNSMPTETRKALADYPQTVFSAKPLWLYPDLLYLGEIPRYMPALTRHAGALTAPGNPPDTIPDDTGLALVTPLGLAVITGCAHAGLPNIIEHACRLTGINTVCAAVGGFHLHEAPPDTLRQTRQYLTDKNIRHLYGGHCTGSGLNGLPRLRPIITGSVIQLP